MFDDSRVKQLILVLIYSLKQSYEKNLAKTSIPIIGYVTTIHDLSKKIPQIFPRNAITSFKIIVQHIHAYYKVTSVEGI